MKREEIEARAWEIVCKDLCVNTIHSVIQDAYTAGLERAAEIAESCTTVKPNWGTRKAIATAIRAEKNTD